MYDKWTLSADEKSRASYAVSDRFNLTHECGHETQHETKVLQFDRMPEINQCMMA